MKNDNADIFKPVGEMSDEEMAALVEDWDYETDHFLGYVVKEERRRDYERMLALCRQLRSKNSAFSFLLCGIDNRSSSASIHIRFSGSFLPADKEMMEIFSELFSISDLAVLSTREDGFMLTLSLHDIWAIFVEFPEAFG